MVKNNDGLTLLEVLLAMTILLAFLVGFSYMIGNSALWDKKNEERHTAMILAHMCMEMSKGVSFDTLNQINEDGTEVIFDEPEKTSVKANLNSICNKIDKTTQENGSIIPTTDINLNNTKYEISRDLEKESNNDFLLYNIEIICKYEDSKNYKLNSKYLVAQGSE